MSDFDYYIPGVFIIDKIMVTGREPDDITTRIFRTKIENPKFRKVFSMRGNHPNICYRYLELKNGQADLIPEVIKYYPEFDDQFSSFENMFTLTHQAIHEYYCQKFIRREYINIPDLYMPIIKALHNDYITTHD